MERKELQRIAASVAERLAPQVGQRLLIHEVAGHHLIQFSVQEGKRDGKRAMILGQLQPSMNGKWICQPNGVRNASEWPNLEEAVSEFESIIPLTLAAWDPKEKAPA